MRLYHLFEKASPEQTEVEHLSIDRTFWKMVSKSDHALPDEAQYAVSGWVGGGPSHKDNQSGLGFGLMHPDRLERAYQMVPNKGGMQIRTELEGAVKPIHDYLRSKFGNTIELYRGYGRHVPSTPGDSKDVRRILSFTTNIKVAESFAGSNGSMPVMTDEEIDACVQEYAKTGQTIAFGYKYVRNVEEYEEMTRGMIPYSYEVFYLDDGKTKTSLGGTTHQLWAILSQNGVMDKLSPESKFNPEEGGTIKTTDGQVFKVTKETVHAEREGAVGTGKMNTFIGADMYSVSDDEEDGTEDGEHITGIEGMPEDIRNSINSENNDRKEWNAVQDKSKKRVKTFQIPVEQILWVTNRFNQQEFIVYVGHDDEKAFPKFDDE